jgi:hypothetical protein
MHFSILCNLPLAFNIKPLSACLTGAPDLTRRMEHSMMSQARATISVSFHSKDLLEDTFFVLRMQALQFNTLAPLLRLGA